MDLFHIAIMVITGVAAGILASVIGGASLVTYPVLIGSGMPPLLATIATNISLVPSNLVAALADRSRLPPIDRNFAVLVLASVVGAGCGAMLLMMTPASVFEVIVPLLLGFATLLFAFSDRIAAWLRARAERRNGSVQFNVTSLKVLLPVSFYGGYFGSGVGILMLGVLSVATSGDYRTANVTKNLVGGLNSGVAAAIYIMQGQVPWPQTLALMTGTIAGGFAGSWIARVMPRTLIRILVTAMGAALTVTFMYRYWLPH